MTYAVAIDLLVGLDIGSTLTTPGAMFSSVFRSPDGYDVGPFAGLDLSAAAEMMSGAQAPDPDECEPWF